MFTGLLTALLGVSSAWIVCRYDFKGRRFLEASLFLAIAIPSYIVAYAYVGIFDNGGSLMLIGSMIGLNIPKIDLMNIWGLIWILSVSLFPYVYVSTRAAFSNQSKSFEESSSLLGASKRKYFFRIALPMAQPAIIGGLFLVFMEVLNDYGAAKYYGINTFTTGIFRTWTALEDLQTALYLSGLLISLVIVLRLLEKLYRGRKSYTAKGENRKSEQESRISASGKQQIFLIILVLLPLVFGLILPVAQLLYWAILSFDKIFNVELFWITLQSLGLALVTGITTLICAFGFVYFSKWNYLKILNIFSRSSVIGYVIPGAIIGIGLISISQSVVIYFDNIFQVKVGYLFYGSSIILIYAYIFRFLAVAYNPIEANSLKIGKSLAESSYLLGKSKISTFFKIEMPLLKTATIGAFVLVFIDTLKELPLTLILKPYDVSTLAVKAFEYADDERVSEAALPALMLIMIVLFLMIFINKSKSLK
jgi:iron(III) transport system permease protein